MTTDQLERAAKAAMHEARDGNLAQYDTVARIVATLDEYLAEQDEDNWCQRLKYGKCSTRKCLVAGGWSPGNPADYSLATCPRYRVQQALEREFTPPASSGLMGR